MYPKITQATDIFFVKSITKANLTWFNIVVQLACGGGGGDDTVDSLVSLVAGGGGRRKLRIKVEMRMKVSNTSAILMRIARSRNCDESAN